MTEQTTLDNLEQAAMLLLCMGEEGASQVMAHLDRQDVEQLSYKMARLSSVTQQEAESVLDRFFNRYKEQAGIARASRAYLQKTLDLALGDRVAKGLIDSIYGDEVKMLVKRLEWSMPSCWRGSCSTNMCSCRPSCWDSCHRKLPLRCYNICRETIRTKCWYA